MGLVNQRLNSMANSRSSTSRSSATGPQDRLRSTSAAVVICARLVETMTPYLPSAESRPTHICMVEPTCTIWYSSPFLEQLLPQLNELAWVSTL